MGRFGNQMFTVAFCKAFAEQHDLEFQCDPWIGQKVFGLNDPPIDEQFFTGKPQLCENTIQPDSKDVLYRSYSQQQKCLIYTRRDCKRWFKFSEEIENKLSNYEPAFCAAHRRCGDYAGYGYPVVSEISYPKAAAHFNVELPTMISDESSPYPRWSGELKDIVDFYMLSKAAILFRGNSTYSWWAATLSHAKVYAPVMTGCEGGKENHVLFTEGNWPAFRTDLPFLTDLHLPE